MITFNKPSLVGNELNYIKEAVENGKISGNGVFTKKCHEFFTTKYNFSKSLLTTSCTDALEMVSILINIKPGDEIIMPSYTFVSTANAFVLRGATIKFVDSHSDNPNMNENLIEDLVTEQTKAIIVVHYAGIACNMGEILRIAKKYCLYVVEDAAQAIDSFYNGKPLGGIGDLGTFSFHETKNIISGEGGLLAINNKEFTERSEIIWEKGTNRSAFFRGEVDKYGWVDIGSSFLASDIIAAFLYGQLENLDLIQNKRKKIWHTYFRELQVLINKGVQLPTIPKYASVNGHLFYIVCKSLEERNQLISFLKENGIKAVFHYQSLHKSLFFQNNHDGRILPNSDKFTNCLVRLPLYYDLKEEELNLIVQKVQEFFNV
jgi:dTDP-4-amino-4,6-dideoxygalactose transaminase